MARRPHRKVKIKNTSEILQVWSQANVWWFPLNKILFMVNLWLIVCSFSIWKYLELRKDDWYCYFCWTILNEDEISNDLLRTSLDVSKEKFCKVPMLTKLKAGWLIGDNAFWLDNEIFGLQQTTQVLLNFASLLWWEKRSLVSPKIQGENVFLGDIFSFSLLHFPLQPPKRNFSK